MGQICGALRLSPSFEVGIYFCDDGGESFGGGLGVIGLGVEMGVWGVGVGGEGF